MDYILRDMGIELWSKVKAKATLERKTVVYKASGDRYLF